MGVSGCLTESARCHAQVPHGCPANIIRQMLGHILAPSMRSIPFWHLSIKALLVRISDNCIIVTPFLHSLRNKTHSLDQCWMQSAPIHCLFLSPIFVFIVISATTRKSVRCRHDIMKLEYIVTFLHPWRRSQQCANAKKGWNLWEASWSFSSGYDISTKSISLIMMCFQGQICSQKFLWKMWRTWEDYRKGKEKESSKKEGNKIRMIMLRNFHKQM